MTKIKIDIKNLVPYWNRMQKETHKCFIAIQKIEKEMQKKFNSEHISFFYCDGEAAGIGTYPFTDEMDLIHDTDLNNFEEK